MADTPPPPLPLSPFVTAHTEDTRHRGRPRSSPAPGRKEGRREGGGGGLRGPGHAGRGRRCAGPPGGGGNGLAPPSPPSFQSAAPVPLLPGTAIGLADFGNIRPSRETLKSAMETPLWVRVRVRLHFEAKLCHPLCDNKASGIRYVRDVSRSNPTPQKWTYVIICMYRLR